MLKTLSKEIIDQVISNIRNIELPWLPRNETIKLMSMALHSDNPIGQRYGISIATRPGGDIQTRGARNEHFPPHAEIYDGKPIKENFVGEIVLVEDLKDQVNMWSKRYLDDITEIIMMPRNKNIRQISHDIKKKIYDWANKKHHIHKNITNWEYLIHIWNEDNPKYQVQLRD